MIQVCKQCNIQFQIDEIDTEFYERFSPVVDGKTFKLPMPKYCPVCRQQRRLSWENQRNLYSRTCEATKKHIISIISPEKPYTVYDTDYWYSDKWDPRDFGRDFDFSRTFTEQFAELMLDVPQISRSAIALENTDYATQIGWCKNCYLLSEADFDEDCYYGSQVFESKNCCDLMQCYKCELCYECMDCRGCYNVSYARNCKTCSDSSFLHSCIGCNNCFLCVNLRNKQYCYKNIQYSKEEYEEKIKSINTCSYQTVQAHKRKLFKLSKKHPKKFLEGARNENSTGNYLNNTKNCINCYDCFGCYDCKHCYNGQNLQNCYDVTGFGSREGASHCLECREVGGGTQHIYFSDSVWDSCYNIFYSKMCVKNSHDLFGCVGMKHNSFCIMNTQYSEQEYYRLVKEVILHMQETGEWGEFLSPAISLFGYNESVAHEYYPLSKEEATKKGYVWFEQRNNPQIPNGSIPGIHLPDYIEDAPENILQLSVICEITGKPFKIIEPELVFYQKNSIPLPRRHPNRRQYDRMNLRNKRELHKQNCDNCNAEIQTTYQPQDLYIIYCEDCFVAYVN